MSFFGEANIIHPAARSNTAVTVLNRGRAFLQRARAQKALEAAAERERNVLPLHRTVGPLLSRRDDDEGVW
jgi:hypothetical protein